MNNFKNSPQILNSSEIPKSDSQTFHRAFQDLYQGWKNRQLWLQLGWQDVKQRYRRSVIGPFWITIATAVMAISLGLLYSVLFDIPIKTFLPYVTVGLIFWNFIQDCILDGTEVFIENEGLIKQLPAPISVHVYRLVWKELIFLAHNIIIYALLVIIFPQSLSWSILLAIPAMLLLVLNAIWISLFFGIFATRYRDVVPLVKSLVQLLFYMTPIVWTTENILARGGKAADRARIVEINPLYHYLEIIRAPLLGKTIHWNSWIVVIVCTLLGWALTILVMKKYRYRVAYWV